MSRGPRRTPRTRARPCHRASGPGCWAATARCGVFSGVLCLWCLQRDRGRAERRVSRYPCRRDGGRLGFRRDGLAAPRCNRRKIMERCGRRRRGAATTGGFPMLTIGTRRRRGAAQQLHGAGGTRRPGRLHAAAATNLAWRHRRDRTQVCKSEKLLLQKSPITLSFAVSRSISTKPGLVGSPGTCVEIKQ